MNKLNAVNDADEIIGTFSLDEIRSKKLSYRLISIFILNKKGNLLIQKRSANKKRFPCYYEIVGGHVDEGETYLDAAKRELFEELNLNLNLTELGKIKINYGGVFKFVMFYLAKYNEEHIKNNLIEVSEFKFVLLKELEIMMKKDKVLPVLIEGLSKFRKDLKNM